MKTKAAVCFNPNEPLKVTELDLAPPAPSEVLIKILSASLCHTDLYTFMGLDSEGVFPCVLGHEGVGVILEVGSDVKNLKVGDYVIPLYTPECGECEFCRSGKTNLCQKIRETQGRGLMPDHKTRFSLDGIPIYHYMGVSSLSEHIVMPEISVVKIEDDLPLKNLPLFGCAIPSGIGAVTKVAKIEKGSSVAVFGLGPIGLSVVQGAKLMGASKIIVIDRHEEKFTLSKKFGATHFIDSNKVKDLKDEVIKMTGGGVGYSFECTGNVDLMRIALEVTHKGWGVSTIIGVAEKGAMISTHPFQLVTGRRWQGSAFGGVKGRSEMNEFLHLYRDKKIYVDEYISHEFKIEEINLAFKLMQEKKVLKALISF